MTTATRPESVVSLPIQALTVRQKGDLEPAAAKKGSCFGGHQERSGKPRKAQARKRVQGASVIVKGEKAESFVKVDTGITGTTEIEVT